MLKNLKILKAYFRIGVIRQFYYRGTLLVDFLGTMISLSFLFFLWTKVYESKSEIAGMTLGGLLIYYLFARTVRTLANPNGASFIGEQIKSGKMQTLILRPGNPLLSYFSILGAKRVFESVVYTIATVIIVFVVFPLFGFETGVMNVSWFLLFTLIAIVLAFLIGALTGMSSFWITDSSPLTFGLGPLTSFLSGLMIPLSFFPATIQKILSYLPFRFMVSDPVLVLQGKISGMQIYNSLLLGLCWLIIFYLLVIFTWQRGSRRFEAVGN